MPPRRKRNQTNSHAGDFHMQMWEAEVKEKCEEGRKQLEVLEKEKMEECENSFRTLLMAIPKHILNMEIDIDSEEFINSFLAMYEDEENEVIEDKTLTPKTPKTIKRRSRSASNVKFNFKHSQKIHRVRSTSVDVYKTPKGNTGVSYIMSHNKYTVSKPRKVPDDSGVRLKRIMKPNEEAISTCGSPLHVLPGGLSVPQVNIPLPGGVILNIEPKTKKVPSEFSNLDATTLHQIKQLCMKLHEIQELQKPQEPCGSSSQF